MVFADAQTAIICVFLARGFWAMSTYVEHGAASKIWAVFVWSITHGAFVGGMTVIHIKRICANLYHDPTFGWSSLLTQDEAQPGHS